MNTVEMEYQFLGNLYDSITSGTGELLWTLLFWSSLVICMIALQREYENCNELFPYGVSVPVQSVW
jgi:hypothetical protein